MHPVMRDQLALAVHAASAAVRKAIAAIMAVWHPAPRRWTPAAPVRLPIRGAFALALALAAPHAGGGMQPAGSGSAWPPGQGHQ